jgi:hypothetical protein
MLIPMLFVGFQQDFTVQQDTKKEVKDNGEKKSKIQTCISKRKR